MSIDIGTVKTVMVQETGRYQTTILIQGCPIVSASNFDKNESIRLAWDRFNELKQSGKFKSIIGDERTK